MPLSPSIAFWFEFHEMPEVASMTSPSLVRRSMRASMSERSVWRVYPSCVRAVVTVPMLYPSFV